MNMFVAQLNRGVLRMFVPGAAGNIPKLLVLSGFSEAMLFLPVMVLFFASAGLNLGEILKLQGIFSLTMALMEIPTGYVSDRWGRKNALVFGSALDIVGVSIYSISYSFWGFAVGEVLLALGACLHSGTVTGMAFDSLLEIGQEHQNRKIGGRLNAANMIGQGLASLLGGAAAIVSLRFSMWLTLLPLTVALVVGLSLHEPVRLSHEGQKHWQAIRRIAVDTLVYNAALRSVIVLSCVIATMTLFLFWYSQPYQEAVGLSLSLFGVAHAVALGGSAVMAVWAHRFVPVMDDRRLMVIAALIVVAMYAALSLPVATVGLLWLFIGRSVWGLTNTVSGDLINRMTTSSCRVTVLSIQSCVGRLMFTVAVWLIGKITGAYSLPHVMLVTGSVGVAALAISFVAMRGVWDRLPR